MVILSYADHIMFKLEDDIEKVKPRVSQNLSANKRRIHSHFSSEKSKAISTQNMKTLDLCTILNALSILLLFMITVHLHNAQCQQGEDYITVRHCQIICIYLFKTLQYQGSQDTTFVQHVGQYSFYKSSVSNYSWAINQ